MKKGISVFLSLILFVLCVIPAFAQGASESLAENCSYMGDFNADGQITAVDARQLLQVASTLRACSAEQLQCNDVNGDGKITAVDARWVLQMASGLRGRKIINVLTGETEDLSPSGLPTFTKEEAVSAVCTWTAAAAKGSYTVNGVCSLTEDADMGSSTAMMNQIIAGLDPNANVNTVFGTFLGVGSVNYKASAGSSDAQTEKYDLKALALTPADVAEYRQEGSTLYFRLHPCTNPQKGVTSLSKVTKAYLTEEELQKQLATGTGPAVTVGNLHQEISDILVTVTVSQGQIETLQIQFTDKMELELKVAAAGIVGKGSTKTVLAYSDFVY